MHKRMQKCTDRGSNRPIFRVPRLGSEEPTTPAVHRAASGSNCRLRGANEKRFTCLPDAFLALLMAWFICHIWNLGRTTACSRPALFLSHLQWFSCLCVCVWQKAKFLA